MSLDYDAAITAGCAWPDPVHFAFATPSATAYTALIDAQRACYAASGCVGVQYDGTTYRTATGADLDTTVAPAPSISAYRAAPFSQCAAVSALSAQQTTLDNAATQAQQAAQQASAALQSAQQAQQVAVTAQTAAQQQLTAAQTASQADSDRQAALAAQLVKDKADRAAQWAAARSDMMGKMKSDAQDGLLQRISGRRQQQWALEDAVRAKASAVAESYYSGHGKQQRRSFFRRWAPALLVVAALATRWPPS